MMRDLREKTKLVMIVVALAFVGLMVFEWGMDISGTTVASQTGELGRVNGQPVPYDAYQVAYQSLNDQARASMGIANLSREQTRQIEDQAFNEVVNDILMAQEVRRRGIRASDAEVMQAARWMPHPDLMQNELFMTEGQFDINKYQQFLASPAANEELLMGLEAYYRDQIPRSKLMRQITAGIYINDAELWKVFRDQTETAMVDYAPLNVSVLVPGDVEVTDREIRDHYNANRERFERPETGRFAIAAIPKVATAADSVAAYERAATLRQEIVGGSDFADVARRASDDPGSARMGGELGVFGRNQMVPEFEAAAFSLPVGEVSEPVESDYGYHLIEVLEREDEQVRARHILISFEPMDEALDALYARADSLEMIAERAGVDRAAQATGGIHRPEVVLSMDEAYVPGVGSALEAVEWARDEQLEDEPLDVSPVFETPEAFFVVELLQYSGRGRISLEAATPEIRRQLILEKKREEARRIGQQMVQEIRGGKSLEEVASERGLSVQQAGPITRTGFNPAFGQANAATGAAFGAPIGEVSDVVDTPGGLFIIRPTQRTEASREQFELQKDQLRQMALFQLQQEAVSRWMDDLREQATILDRRDEMLVTS